MLLWICNSRVFFKGFFHLMFFVFLYEPEIVSRIFLMDTIMKRMQTNCCCSLRLKVQFRVYKHWGKNMIVCDWFGELAICGFVYMALQIICAIHSEPKQAKLCNLANTSLAVCNSQVSVLLSRGFMGRKHLVVDVFEAFFVAQ